MHICFICSEFPGLSQKHGGIGVFVDTLSRELARRGHDISIIGIGQSKKDIVKKIEGRLVVQLRQSQWVKASFVNNAMRLNFLLRKINGWKSIDIVEGQEGSFAFIFFRKAKKIVRLHGGHSFFTKAEKRKLSHWKLLQEVLSFRKSDGFISVSKYVLDVTRTLLTFPDVPTRIIFNPIDIDKFSTEQALEITPAQILFIGTITRKKGVEQLVQAFLLVRAQVPKASLLLVGRDANVDGVSFSRYLQDKYKLSNERVKFVGPVRNNDLLAYIASSQICCCPSHMESFGIIWGEILAAGRPLVASNTGPGPEVVKDKVTGLLCNPNSPIDIAEKIMNLLKDPQSANALAEAGRLDVVHRFSLRGITDRNIEFYKEILK